MLGYPHGNPPKKWVLHAAGTAQALPRCVAGKADAFTSVHWIGLRENLNRKPMGFYHQIDRVFRFQFSHHPILWMVDFMVNMKKPFQWWISNVTVYKWFNLSKECWEKSVMKMVKCWWSFWIVLPWWLCWKCGIERMNEWKMHASPKLVIR